MAYEPKTWECGETITADDLNHMENGITDASDIVNVNVVATGSIPSASIDTIDKTFDELLEAHNSGKTIVANIHSRAQYYPVDVSAILGFSNSMGELFGCIALSPIIEDGGGGTYFIYALSLQISANSSTLRANKIQFVS